MQARSIQQLGRQPIGGYATGRRFLLGFPSAHLQVIIGWGAIGAAEAGELAAALRAQRADLPRHASFVDLRGVVDVASAALEVLAAAMLELAPLNQRITTRGAIVRPPGVAGMAIAGFWTVVPAGYPVRTFVDARAALRWLAHPAARIGADLAAWEHLRARCDVGELTTRLRGLLARPGGPTELNAAARLLGVTARTLQRRLADDASSFRREVEAGRVARAQQLLVDPARDIKAIAAAVGIGSPAAFATMFRRVTGQTPTAWRQARLWRAHESH